jgi:predicted nucleic acid-binding protein
LDAGEAEAIALAHEQGISTVLIDERLGREVVQKNGLEIMGIGGVLLTAKSRGLIPLVRPILDLLREKSRFWLSDSVYLKLLQLAGE